MLEVVCRSQMLRLEPHFANTSSLQEIGLHKSWKACMKPLCWESHDLEFGNGSPLIAMRYSYNSSQKEFCISILFCWETSFEGRGESHSGNIQLTILIINSALQCILKSARLNCFQSWYQQKITAMFHAGPQGAAVFFVRTKLRHGSHEEFYIYKSRQC